MSTEEGKNERERERARERGGIVVTEALFFLYIPVWDFGVTPDSEVCHVDRIRVSGAERQEEAQLGDGGVRGEGLFCLCVFTCGFSVASHFAWQ